MIFPRESGILLHPTSLPGPYGIGEIGPHAHTFALALSEMGQRLWQILPLGPADFAHSPYQSPSTFAGNPMMISLDDLKTIGLLDAADLAGFPAGDPAAVDYVAVIPARERALDLACGRFAERADSSLQTEFAEYLARHDQPWLHDYALFTAIKADQGGDAWPDWRDRALRARERAALDAARNRLAPEIDRVKIQQFLFMRQWRSLRAHCHRLGLKIVGDLPIFVAHDSAEVWSSPELFHLDKNGQPTVVAGVPPDYFSKTGQRWGNPLYRWEAMARDDYAWWKKRARHVLDLVDLVRIDHFRGFQAYWEIPAAEETAVNGQWIAGPGIELFHAFQAEFGDLPIIAEDLGDIDEKVERLRDDLQLPGMKILQFAFDGDDENPFLPHNFTPNCVCYTGTHDNNTAVGWYRGDAARTPEEIERDRHNARSYMGVDGSEIHWSLIELGWRSSANTAIAPLQDLLGLDGSARLNTPGEERGNWRWRFQWSQLTPEIKQRIRQLTEETGRL